MKIEVNKNVLIVKDHFVLPLNLVEWIHKLDKRNVSIIRFYLKGGDFIDLDFRGTEHSSADEAFSAITTAFVIWKTATLVPPQPYYLSSDM